MSPRRATLKGSCWESTSRMSVPECSCAYCHAVRRRVSAPISCSSAWSFGMCIGRSRLWPIGAHSPLPFDELARCLSRADDENIQAIVNVLLLGVCLAGMGHNETFTSWRTRIVRSKPGSVEL